MRVPGFNLPPLEWIRAFEAAARCGSFTAAATETGLTQSAISQRIGHLEKLLGARLFHRRARSIALTVEGEAWLPHVQTSLDNLLESSEALFGARKGKLAISASQSIIELWLAPRLQQLRQVTDAQISVQTMVLGSHSAPQDDVLRIRYGSGNWPHHYKYRLYAEQVAPVASRAMLELPGHWTEWPRIACSGPRPGWNDWAQQFGIPTTPVPGFRFDTYASAQRAARTGVGVFLASLPLCRTDIESGRLVRLGKEVLGHHETYWLMAGRDAITRAQWEALEAVMQ